ncbi:Sphingomyelinase [Basidiobolus meristosporus CBS 931.73]|uniref:sphingomyelin phosphodiesterase n=1 Tax=Basidiobolus meristosporus CBS 931.73 TaxID=1314790 RepID=A0A1Y1Y7E0_9FUNG|nr:Sphingomyelinase [Basidiobolus meristosporus CBS 931.73]|eukprot:ORX93646.1 Sphingomyelinase [Basidiobolus meristosporus CBS 931.73]
MKATILLSALFTLANGYPTGSQSSIKALSHNIYLMSKLLYPNWGQDIRAKLIGNADYFQGHDFVFIQEAFEASSRQILVANTKAQYPYRTEVIGLTKSGWNATLGNFRTSAAEDGGVMTISKWPIDEKIQYIYNSGCGADYFSNKGFAYVKINRNGEYIHVFNTHLQADDSLCSKGQARSVRTSQLLELRRFLDEKKIPKDQLVLFGGDLNVNKGSTEFTEALQTLNAVAPAYDGLEYTYDPKTNAIAKWGNPNSPGEYLDHIWYHRDHLALRDFKQTALLEKSEPYTIKKVEYRDFSDHYPVQVVANVDEAK